jgi:hypothetical protein
MTSADDISLLAHIREIYDELDPLPPEVVTAARRALAWRTVDAELAELTLDSLTEQAAVRSSTGPRLVSFEAESLTVDVEVGDTGDTGDTRRLVGQLVPPRPAQVTVRSASGEHTVEANDIGCFTAEGIAPGPVSLLCRVADSPDRPVVTSWIAI